MRQKLLTAVAVLGLAASLGIVPGGGGALAQPPPVSATGNVDFGTDLQPFDGFGFASAFQRAALMNGLFGLTPENQLRAVDLMFNPETGLGYSIMRLGIGSSVENPYDLMLSIQPEDPGGPDATPQYSFDGYDGGQVWLARHAQTYGVERFFADAWSAPAYMKTNGDDRQGGMLCGVPGAVCASGDWRQAYADYLLQYVDFYADEGITLTELGFTNEPDFTASYASMRFDPAQAVDFIKVIGPTIDAAGVDINLVCCDSFGYEHQAAYTRAIEADPEAARWVDVHTGHNYASRARSPLPTDRPQWMSEFALPAGAAWNPAWDNGANNDGITLANDIHNTLVLGEVNAYITWFGMSRGATTAPLQADGENLHIAQRLYATAAYSRFIRPDAFRVPAQASSPDLKISGFRNADGSRVINVINNGNTATSLDLALAGVPAATHMVSYLTDQQHSLTRTGESVLTGPAALVDLPARSLTTLVIEDCTSAVTGAHTGRLTVSSGTTCLADGAAVTGPVIVRAGASLVATGATVDGPVVASDAATVRLSGAAVTGPVSVSGATERVLIAGTEVTGPLSVTDAGTGFAQVVISGNTVTGPLSCAGNAPAPTDEGVPNTVAGGKRGQCRDL